jgi:ubiquinol-cytochrome c reductase cytochrome b subunit
MLVKGNHPILKGIEGIMIKDVPKYGNKFFYSLGFLSMIAFMILVVTGTIMTIFGPSWWLTNGLGVYTRSVHLWATQAFVIFILLHLLVVFFTSGFKKPRRLSWMLGVLMLFIVIAETEFGYVLRGDYSSQWRSLQGADFYNGAGLGNLLNPLNQSQIFGIHVVVVPLVLIGLLFFHYLLVRVLGIAKPYRKEIQVKTVPANHGVLFIRGGLAVATVLLLAFLFPSPYIKPTTIQTIAQDDPLLFGKTVTSEFDLSSNTATYMDNIDPYTFNTRQVYIDIPYQEYYQVQQGTQANALAAFNAESSRVQQQQLKEAEDYFTKDDTQAQKPSSPVMTVVADLTTMAQVGLYEPSLSNAAFAAHIQPATATDRFLSDTGVLSDEATILGITTDQYGMVREEKGKTPGAWWLLPIGLLNHTVLASDNNGDRDGALIFGSLLLTMLAFPFIPYVNQLPDKMKVYKLIWR